MFNCGLNFVSVCGYVQVCVGCIWRLKRLWNALELELHATECT